MQSISSLVECAHKIAQGHQPEEERARHVIALSAGTGTDGAEVGKILADRLGMSLFNRDIVELLARETDMHKGTIERMDERGDGFKGAWLYSILTGLNISRDNYLKNLTHVIRGIAACKGGIILGRGGSFILSDLPVLRAHIVGSLPVCAERLMTQEGITRKEAERKIQETDKSRGEYLKNLFQCDNNDPRHYDLVINSDHLAPARIAGLIIEARRHITFE